MAGGMANFEEIMEEHPILMMLWHIFEYVIYVVVAIVVGSVELSQHGGGSGSAEHHTTGVEDGDAGNLACGAHIKHVTAKPGFNLCLSIGNVSVDAGGEVLNDKFFPLFSILVVLLNSFVYFQGNVVLWHSCPHVIAQFRNSGRLGGNKLKGGLPSHGLSANVAHALREVKLSGVVPVVESIVANACNTIFHGLLSDDIVVAAKQVDVYLSQEETLQFAEGDIEIQLNWTYGDGSRAATKIKRVSIGKNLIGRVLE